MVVSVGKATSTDYYTGGGGVAEPAASYYLDAVTSGEPAGRWAGSGAARLGLDGEVDAKEMDTLYGEFVNPRTGEPVGSRPAQRRSVDERMADALAAEPDALPERIEEIRRQIERTDRQSVIGWDATFSVAKSVTVAHTAAHRAELAAIRSGDADRAAEFGAIRQRIEEAIHTANAAMIDYAETLTTARSGGGAGAPVEWRPAPGLTVAEFFQHTSRNIDPQLHIHNVILNRAWCVDGKVRALDGADLLAQKHALGAVADRVLEEALTAAGFTVELRPDETARELTVVPTDVMDVFSSRSQQISARVAELLPAAEERRGRELTDRELYHLKRAATLATRSAKGAHVPETTEEMLDRWAAETEAEAGTRLDSVADAIRTHLAERQAAPAVDPEWSPSAVLTEAVAACGEQRSTWRRSDLTREIARRLPSLGGLSAKDTVALLDQLTDLALTGETVRQISGHATIPGVDDSTPAHDVTEVAPEGGPLAGLADDPYTRPSARLYATTDTLLAEESLRRAAIDRGGRTLAADDVATWLDKHCPTIGADQRAAVLGLASSDARLAVLVGPAGTGKSFTAGAFANAWREISHADGGTAGRVIGLADSEIAATVLKEDGVHDSMNIDMWLGVQDRLAEGSTHARHLDWRLGPGDVVMVDESSMVATADLERIHGLVEDAGARLVLTGDPRQLGAVEAGGVMGLLDGHAETYTLTDVRRFATDWEPEASLALRDGDPDALAAYDRHGRLLAYESTDDAVEAAARAAVADRVDGRSVVVVAGTNDQAAAIATKVRDQLVSLGLVESHGVILGLDGCAAGVGDIVATRQNDYGIGVTNRAQYQVTSVGADGSLTVTPVQRGTQPARESADDRPAGGLHLPAGYVAKHVQLGYASTVHAAEGLTVDAGHVVTDGSLDAAALYVAMTRGRLRNTAHTATTPKAPDTAPGLDATEERPSARSVLEGCLERDEANRAAMVEAENDLARRTSMSALAGAWESTVRVATRERMDRHLDQLTAEGALDQDVRARLCADQGSEHLARLLRAIEQTGGDPRQTLADAIAVRGLTDADSVAQVLSHRITGGNALRHPQMAAAATGIAPPDDIAPAARRHLARIEAVMAERRADLGREVAAEPPPWALTALGPVPSDEEERSRWQERAGAVAAHREATGWNDDQRAIGQVPGLAATERRASYTLAWNALGRPEAGLNEAALTEGQLRVRVRAAELEKAWAPPHADAALRAAETGAEAARQNAALARAAAEQAQTAGDHEAAERRAVEAAEHDREATAKAAAVQALTATSRSRAAWAAAAAPTLDEGARSGAELERRGITIGSEPDRTTAAEWLAADRAARQADDAHRPITELDIDSSTDSRGSTEDSTAADEPVAADMAERPPAGQHRSAAHAQVSEQPTPAELDAMTAATSFALARIADRASQEGAHADAADLDDGVESYEEGRHRREASDELTAAADATDHLDTAAGAE